MSARVIADAVGFLHVGFLRLAMCVAVAAPDPETKANLCSTPAARAH